MKVYVIVNKSEPLIEVLTQNNRSIILYGSSEAELNYLSAADSLGANLNVAASAYESTVNEDIHELQYKSHLKTYLINGPKINGSQFLIEEFVKNNRSITLYGDGKDEVDCLAIANNFEENSNIIVHAHGLAVDEKTHELVLCLNSYSDPLFYDPFLHLNSLAKTLNFELFSCEGGAAINNVPQASTLITFASYNHTSLISINNEIIKKSISYLRYDNPFIKFAYYLFSNPDLLQFAINDKLNKHIFIASLDLLENYSISEIRKWQLNKLNDFIGFCNGVRSELVSDRQEQITETLMLLQNKYYLNNWLIQFDTVRYRELLLINMSYNNELELVEKILASDVDKNTKTEKGCSVLSLAILQGHYNIVKAFLMAGASPHEKDLDGDSVLLNAIRSKDTEIMKLLLKAGASPNEKDLDGNSVLLNAIRRKDTEIMKLLLEAGASPNEKDLDGNSVLLHAIRSKDTEIMKLLLEAGASPNEKNLDGNSLLFSAARVGHLEEMKILLEAGASPDEKDQTSNSILYNLCFSPHTEAIKILLEYGVSVNDQSNGSTALDKAALYGLTESVELLLASGAGLANFILKESQVKEIVEAGKIFKSNPIKYIIDHNKSAKLVLNALFNLEEQCKDFSIANPLGYAYEQQSEICKNAALSNITKILEYLELPGADLNAISGENGAYLFLIQ